MDNIYSAYHYACKTKADREVVEQYANEAIEQFEKATETAALASFGNIGDIKYTARTTVPNGGAWCDGSTYAKADFEAVYKMLTEGALVSVDMSEYDYLVAEKGSCGFFGLDIATETFKVPTLSDVFVKAGQEADEFGAESLPNIKGTLPANSWQAGTVKLTGSFYNAGTSSYGVNTVGSSDAGTAFNASLSSSTYQDGAKVNPDHVKYRAYIVLFTAEKELSVVDWTNRINEVAEERMAELQAGGLTTIKYWDE